MNEVARRPDNGGLQFLFPPPDFDIPRELPLETRKRAYAIKAARHYFRIPKRDAAAAIGISAEKLSNLERGLAIPDPEQTTSIINFYNVIPEYIMQPADIPDFSPFLNALREAQPREIAQPGIAFLGRVMREQPEIIEELSPRDAYILFAHIDPHNWRSFKDLGNTVSNDARRIFIRTLDIVHAKAKPEIQRTTPIDTINASIQSVARRRMSEASQRLMSDPSYVADLHKKRWESPEQRRRASELAKGATHSFETRRRRSESIKKIWEDPKYRQKREAIAKRVGEQMRGREQSEESKAARRVTMRAIWQDPEYRDHMLEARRSKRGLKRTPEARANMRKGLDPDYQLWKHASKSGLVTRIINDGLMTREELDIIQESFGRRKTSQAEKLLDKFSTLIARLSE